MTRNKIIFSILGIILLGIILYIAFSLWGNTSNTNTPTQKSGDMTIWLLGSDKKWFEDLIKKFAEAAPDYAKETIIVENFDDPETYKNTLTAAFSKGQAPDLFVIQNDEDSLFEDQIRVIDPSYIAPSNFKLRYKALFAQDLVVSDPNDASVEFLKWVPLGYQTPAIIYNKRYFLKPTELETWSDFSVEVSSIAEKYSTLVPIALGNGKNVTHSSDIVSALFVSGGAQGLEDLNSGVLQDTLGFYNSFLDSRGDNAFSRLDVSDSSLTDIDYFTQGETAAMIGFPEDLKTIQDIGYQKGFLFVSPFPQESGEENIYQLARYNALVMNKNSLHNDLAQVFLAYLESDLGQSDFYTIFPLQLPALTSLEADMSEKKILSDYNPVYGNFIISGADLVSFNKKDALMYDQKLRLALDMESGYDKQFLKDVSFVVCSATKSHTLLNLSSPCK